MSSIFSRLSTLFLPLRMGARLGCGWIGSKERRTIIAASYGVLWSIARGARKSASVSLWFRGVPFDIILESSADFALIREVFLDEEYAHQEVADVKCVFDVGANVGVASLYFHSLYPRATLYAFEPDPILFEKLRLRVSAIPQIVPLQIALSDHDGEAAFYRHGGSPLAGSLLPRSKDASPLMVKTRRLSSIATEFGIGSIGLLKFDIEGAESNLFATPQDRACVERLVGEVHLDLLGMSKQEFAELLPEFKVAYVRKTAKDRFIAYGAR